MNQLQIGGRPYSYDILLRGNQQASIALGIVSYLPVREAVPLLQICVQSIRKYCSNVQIWVCDNCSPEDNLEWLMNQPDINIILNRTAPEGGSMANAVGLELIKHHLPPVTRFFMTLHQDTAFCAPNGLSHLRSKLNDKVKASGVRFDTARCKEGVLHVLGYMVDLVVFNELNLDFLPDLPHWDVGDKAIDLLRRAGYQIASTRNTQNSPALANLLSEPFKEFQVDRALDDDGNVFFLHLGRGVLKSTGEYYSENKSLEKWVEFCRSYLEII